MRFQVDMWRLPGSGVGLSFLPLLSEGNVSPILPRSVDLDSKGGKRTRDAWLTRFDLATGQVIWVVGSGSVSAARVGKVISADTTVIGQRAMARRRLLDGWGKLSTRSR